MIFITLGTQDKSFKRLLENIQKEIDKGNIKEKVIVQAGFTKFKSKNMEIIDLLDKETFDKYIKNCNLLITHGGVGSILTGLKNSKKIIACPRLAKYQEHINDHQKEIVDIFSKKHYILAYNEEDNLENILKLSKTFKPQKFQTNTSKIINIITNFIDNN